MRIAQIAPLAESVPPKLYGGTERVVSYLTEELVRRKHQVTLFASGDSRTSADLVEVVPHALRLDHSVQDYTYYDLILLDRVMQEADDFDVLHFHTDAIHLPFIHPIKEKTVTTLHYRMDLPDLKPLYRAFSDIPLVSISSAQRSPMPPVHWMGNVPHGVPSSLYKPHLKPGNYLAFLGRIAPEKGPDQAIAIAERVDMPLKIAAKVGLSDTAYFEERIRPLLNNPLVDFIGEISDAEKEAFLGESLALLFPIDWPEPFGLTMIEAMAVGTPVIAYNRGSVPEVVKDGLSGFIVHDIDEAANAVRNISTLDRDRIRHYFEEYFTAERMTNDYLSIYDNLAASMPKTRRMV